MTAKVALVTGTSTGLGLATSIHLAKKGYKVYATMRNLDKRVALDKEAEAQGVSLSVMRLDVRDTATVQQCVDAIMEQEGRYTYI
ncbi:short-chain dehydrogenase/reductase SDR [Kipferlia bialata]|uniref:3-oxoacyl-[acyl-carrier-protein] reductase n=1 Tax=Kipferlia bialata TaxID=797122 RepID=A0A391P1K7_9EUKA|nr:short-chain dehydrogenase/reductase SDR [Kipferlia bialata]|eukprot:g13844.t1